jgi:hypothetical protein
MSRALPPHPNLEHLRNQAKDLLRDWRQDRPDAQLADALHAIARDYGFASWPKLKAHVDSLRAMATPPGPPTEHPFAGTWTANLAVSQRHPANRFQHAVLRIEIAGDAVTIAHTGIDASGQDERSTHTLQVDGQEHPTGQGSGYAVIATWLDSHLLETVAKKDGRIVGSGTYEVSTDGRTLTTSTRAPAANADGWRTDFEQVIVFDRS